MMSLLEAAASGKLWQGKEEEVETSRSSSWSSSRLQSARGRQEKKSTADKIVSLPYFYPITFFMYIKCMLRNFAVFFCLLSALFKKKSKTYSRSTINRFMPNGMPHLNQLDESILNLRVVG